ncbi:MAG: GTPase Era [Anaerolineae bacterium]|nr:MAG: GTPase Era [Anaerolineae bacterium]
MVSEHRSGFVAVSGRPNVGKSTLLNAILAQDILPVSPKPQTTRVRQLAILTTSNAQAIFVDTPGIHRPRNRLGQYMNSVASNALKDADVILCVFDVHQAPKVSDRLVAEAVLQHAPKAATIAALNKMDLVRPERLQSNWNAFLALLPAALPVGVSATRGDNLDLLTQEIVDRLPEGPRYFSDSEITDAYERDIAADLIRSAALALLRDEVPHSLAVQVDEYAERGERGAYIAATIYVERDSQKGIVIGKRGSMLREIGKRGRESIEQMSGRKVYLDLRVKVWPGWRDDAKALRQLGYG